MAEPKVHDFDEVSFLTRNLYEFYFNCDYYGPEWTGVMRFDLKMIKKMPVLYPEQVRRKNGLETCSGKM